MTDTPANYDFQFVAPFPIQACRNIIQNNLENIIRDELQIGVITINVVSEDEESSTFYVRVSELVRATGYLRVHGPYTTYVYGYISKSRTATIMYGLFMVGLLLSNIWFVIDGNYVSPIISGVVALFVTYLYRNELHNINLYEGLLETILHQTFAV